MKSPSIFPSEVIPQQAPHSPIPLTVAQERYWLLDLVESGNPAYQVGCGLLVKGVFDHARMQESFALLLKRHGAFCTEFSTLEDRPVQRIVSDIQSDITVIPEYVCTSGEFEKIIRSELDGMLSTGFNLSKPPLVRCQIIPCVHDHFAVLMTAHRIIADERSMEIALRDLGRIYTHDAGKLPELTVNFADYAAWLSGLDETVLEEHRTFWEKAMGDDIPVLGLLTKPRPRRTTYSCSTVSRSMRLSTFSGDSSEGQAFSATVVGILLSRHSGNNECMIGFPAGGRFRPELENIVGRLIGILPLRLGMKTDIPCAECIREVNTLINASLSHQVFTLEKILQILDLPRDTSRHPLFQAVLTYGRGETPGFGELGSELFLRGQKNLMFDLEFVVTNGSSGYQLDLKYNPDLFEKEQADRFADHFVRIAQAIDRQPDLKVSEIYFLSSEERAEILEERNATEKAFAQDSCVHELFMEQAARTPDAIAVRCASRHMTYARLDEESNRLARYLSNRGVAAGDRVAICMERSIPMMTALLGALKCGATYVPVDTNYPPERITYMLQDAQVSAILTLEKHRSALPSGDSRIVMLDTEEHTIAGMDGSPLRMRYSSDQCIYMIYTSGSTGVPKGSLVYHRGFVNLIHWYVHEFGITSSDKYLMVSSLSFDLTQKNLFAPLVCGGELVILDTPHLDPERALEIIRNEAVTVVNCTPSTFHGLLANESDESLARLKTLRYVFLGGEPISTTRLALWTNSSWCSAQVVNSYGPTECTDVCAFHRLSASDFSSTVPVPIGRPITNTRLYVLDEQFRIVPDGAPGELCIAGAGVGAGYFGKPDLTQSKFISDPYGASSTDLMYRTGDRVRYRLNGDIEFLGRFDHQVKVRGYRIELDEIRAVLEGHEQIREAVVVAGDDQSGEKVLIAYIVPKNPSTCNLDAVGSYAGRMLPSYMVPSYFLVIDAIPMSPNGKVDRRRLPQPQPTSDSPQEDTPLPEDSASLEGVITGMWREMLGNSRIGALDRFFDSGGTSLKGILFIGRIGQLLKASIPMTALFEAPTVRQFAGLLRKKFPDQVKEKFPAEQVGENLTGSKHPRSSARRMSRMPGGTAGNEKIAVIGMAVRVPGADTVEEFWNNLKNGVESIRPVSESEMIAAGVLPEVFNRPDYVRVWASIDNIEEFDAGLFDISPREAELMDPQHRVMLECAWNALEDAGYDPFRYPGFIGVFGGVARNAYYSSSIASHRELLQSAGDYRMMLGNEKDFPATRIAYKLNLRGPAINIQTACSSSAVAMHLAADSLRRGECDLALVGGCRIIAPANTGYPYVDGGTLSPDGHIRAFDSEAQGMVRGSGVAFVVLKRLTDALEDRDTIRAVILGSAINNDGSEKVGFTAPGVSGQARAISDALASAGVSADTISYVEAHGTGTSLGDPIEIAALQEAFRESTSRTGFCRIGSVKTNIGHLDAGACVAGVIKTALSFEHHAIPPSLNYVKPNPRIDFAASPFVVNNTLTPWNAGNTPRRAGVSSFGLGGTNVHIVLEEAPNGEKSGGSRPFQLILLSAKSLISLDRSTEALVAHIKSHPDMCTADMAYTLQTGRAELSHRRILVCSNKEDAAVALDPPDPRRCFTGVKSDTPPEIVFMFPGQGSQHVNMALDIYINEEVFRNTFDECSRILQPILGVDIRSIVFPGEQDIQAASDSLRRTGLTQPILFSIEYALARLWMHWGIRPSVCIGHSIGEYVGACLAGVFTLEDALAIVANRANLMQAVAAGSMRAVTAAEKDILPYLTEHMAIAACNAPGSCVVSGPTPDMEEFDRICSQKGISSYVVHTSHAFHSPMMDPVYEPFARIVAKYRLSAPAFPIMSTLTGSWLKPEEARDPHYWAKQLRNTVRFSDGISRLLKEEKYRFLEVGPSTILSTSVRRHAEKGSQIPVTSSLPHAQEDLSALAGILGALGRLWLIGSSVDWEKFYSTERRNRIPLPGYRFDRKRYWIEPARPAHNVPGESQTPVVSERSPEMTIPTTDEAAPLLTREEYLQARIRELLLDISGIEFGSEHKSTSFLEMGLDSLVLTQVASRMQNEFGVPLRFRQFMEELSDTESLSKHLDKILPPTAFTPPRASPPTPETPAVQEQTIAAALPISLLPSSGPASVEQVLLGQLDLMAKQLEMLGYGANTPQQKAISSQKQTITARRSAEISAPPPKAFGAGANIDRLSKDGLSQPHRQRLNAWIDTYVAKTKRSKEYATTHRRHYADPRTVSGFTPLLKETVYPIVVNRSQGSKVWDIDGNEYVDITSCFGANLLGYNPPDIKKAVDQQLKTGFEIGPQHPLAGEVARLMSELTGLERVVFCVTGSEAVMTAMRLARTVSGRNLIVTFNNSYHGNFDEVIVRGTPRLKSIPASPGIPPQKVENLLVLDYGADESLRTIRARINECAAVMVEPVQSRDLSLQPALFLKELRTMTEEAGVALIFDEMVTGFRVHTGGAQAHFGIKADLATYGKIIGGGMPVGAVAGIPKYMDALDGGMWEFGDDSVPETGVTYFAGTFVRHPVTLAAMKASLEYMKRKGPALQESINRKMAGFIEEMKRFLQATGAPMHFKHFSSACRPYFDHDAPTNGFFYALLRHKGVHIFDGRTWFFTEAHSAEDIALVSKAVQESVSEMIDMGFLTPCAKAGSGVTDSHVRIYRADDAPEPGAGIGRSPEGDPGWYREDAKKPGSYWYLGRIDSGKDRPEPARVADNPFKHGQIELVSPTTDSQKEVWLTSIMGDDGNRAYNESVSVMLTGNIDLEALKTSTREGILRHEAMKTSFSSECSYFCVAKTIPLEIPLVDLSSLPEKERSERHQEILTGEVTTAFDLRFGPLVRAQVVRLADTVHNLIITSHHIVCDGWSIDVVVKDIGALYTARITGTQPELPDPETYSWYALHMANAREQGELDASEKYWTDLYASGVPVVDFPVDKPRPAIRTFDAQRIDAPIPAELLAGIKRVSKETGCTLVTVMLAAFKAFLYRLTGQTELTVGLPAAGQSIVGKRNLVGHCVNLLPLRTTIDPNAPFLDLAKSVRSLLLDSQEHQTITFGALLKNLKIVRDPARIPLAPIIFNIDLGLDLSGMRFGDLKVYFHSNPRRYENFEIFLNIAPGGGGNLIVEVTYNSNLFKKETVQSRIGEYLQILRSVADTPREQIGRLMLLPPGDQSRLSAGVRGTDAGLEQTSIWQLFERRAAQCPNAVALVCNAEKLTYRELAAKATALSRDLHEKGVGSGTVGIYLERSCDMVTAMIGILKAGAAYVPIDPQFPADRITHIVHNSGMNYVVTRGQYRNESCLAAVKPILIENLRPEAQPAPDDILDANPSDLAYVIYTSGSTGIPKGVEIRQYSVVNFLLSMQREPGITGSDRLLAVTTLSFDIAVLELLLPVITGAQCIIADNQDVFDGRRLLKLIETHGITMMQATPATWRMLLESGLRDSKGMKILCGGEALSRDLADRLLDTGADVWNMYGPTETTVWSMVGKVDRDTESPHLGHPIANTQLYIVDSNLNLLPSGIPGELLIGGEGLAAGYHGLPELTAEKFIRPPFVSDSSCRVYRTGDLVCLGVDGTLRYLGRMDFQVKIRGFRIELGEIEHHIDKIEQIQKSVVVVREDTPGDRKLVAYYVSGSDLTMQILRDHLGRSLPQYMIPALFVRLPSFPLTPNGKIDRKALPRPELDSTNGKKQIVEPRTEMERTISRIWERVLGLKQISVQDSFFDLGGDSLLAARIFANIEKETGKIIPLAALFEHQTIEQLASHIAGQQNHGGWNCVVPIRATGTRPPVFLVHGAEGNVLLYRNLVSHLPEEYPVYGIQSRGLDGKSEILADIESMAAGYIREIRNCRPRGPYYLAGYCMGGMVAVEIANQLTKTGERVGLLALLETYNYSAHPIPKGPLHNAWENIQNVQFHIGNLLESGPKQGARFFAQKLSIEAQRFTVKMDIAKNRVQEKLGIKTGISYRHKLIDKINDAASEQYVPRPFPGRITLFRPVRHYSSLKDPLFGWGTIARDGVEVHTIKANPRGMLVEPFVRDVAAKLRECLEKDQPA